MNDDSAEQGRETPRERYPRANRYVFANAIAFLTLWGAAGAVAINADLGVSWAVLIGMVANMIHTEVMRRLKRREAEARERRELIDA